MSYIDWSDDPIEGCKQAKAELEAITKLVNKNLKEAGFKTIEGDEE